MHQRHVYCDLPPLALREAAVQVEAALAAEVVDDRGKAADDRGAVLEERGKKKEAKGRVKGEKKKKKKKKKKLDRVDGTKGDDIRPKRRRRKLL